MNLKILKILLPGLFLLTAGCSQSLQNKPAKLLHFNSIKNKAVLLDIARDVLEDLHFVIEKDDIDAGYIKTRPLSGSEFFELWRKDSIGSKNLAYSSIHTTQRFVEINISAVKDGFTLSCQVTVERLTMPNREITGFSDMPAAFSRSGATMQKLKLQKELRRKMRWVNIGYDQSLAGYIEKEILDKI